MCTVISEEAEDTPISFFFVVWGQIQIYMYSLFDNSGLNEKKSWNSRFLEIYLTNFMSNWCVEIESIFYLLKNFVKTHCVENFRRINNLISIFEKQIYNGWKN